MTQPRRRRFLPCVYCGAETADWNPACRYCKRPFLHELAAGVPWAVELQRLHHAELRQLNRHGALSLVEWDGAGAGGRGEPVSGPSGDAGPVATALVAYLLWVSDWPAPAIAAALRLSEGSILHTVHRGRHGVRNGEYSPEFEYLVDQYGELVRELAGELWDRAGGRGRRLPRR